MKMRNKEDDDDKAMMQPMDEPMKTAGTRTDNITSNNTKASTTGGLNTTSATAGPAHEEDDGDDRWKNNQEGRMKMMWMTEQPMIPSATGTLDRKTSQASIPTCLYNNHQKTQDD
jgi:hypothetical protein